MVRQDLTPKKIFQRWDKDKDGKLDFDEMHDLIFSLGPDISEAEFEQFFQYIDHDGDDFIQNIEFDAFVNKVTKQKVVRKKIEKLPTPRAIHILLTV